MSRHDPSGEYYCPSCLSTRHMHEDDPVNCLKCHHIMYWRPYPGTDGDRCIFCGTPELEEGEHYWFCQLWDEPETDNLAEPTELAKVAK
jgi:hypothetical protein